MDNLARQEQDPTMFQEMGVVVEIERECFWVAVGDSRYRAQKAAGCLLYPEVEDKVLVVSSSTGECYILSVLERTKSTRNRLLFDGDTELLSPNGNLQLAGKQGVNVTSPSQIRIVSTNLQVVAEQSECSISHLSYIGNFLEGKVALVKLMAGKMESIFDCLRQKVKRSYREVEDIDQLKAGKIDYNAERLMSLRGKYSVVTAKENIKIDGKMIHMG